MEAFSEEHDTSVPTGAWHTLSLRDLVDAIGSSEGGLTDAEARARLQQIGPNRLPAAPPPAWWAILLRQFRSPLIYILVLAAMVSLVIAHLEDAIFIAGVLALNAAIGGYQEWRAEQNTRALQTLLHIRTSVTRDGDVRDVDAEEIVPGDIVWLESGNRVPADLRLLGGHGLQIDESLLTGESLAIVKDPAWTGDDATPVADRRNMAYAGSTVVRGRSKGLVVATGAATTIGQLALDVLRDTGGTPPLLERMEYFARAVAYAVLVAAAGIALLGIVARGYSPTEMFLFGVALAVSAIPEGLPVALTVALAIATARMARRGVLVRRLAAVEGLGSCTCIGSDKTGTLTCNELTVRELQLPTGEQFEVTGEGFAPEGTVLGPRSVGPGEQGAGGSGEQDVAERRPVLPGHEGLNALARAAILCNEGTLHHRNGAWVWRGDPTDLALLSLGHKLGWTREAALDAYPQLTEIPFEPEQQFAASYHRVNDEIQVFVKGSPERVLDMCAEEAPRWIETWQRRAASMAERGLRVLALAEGSATRDHDAEQIPLDPSGCRFLGVAGMIDPLRPGARDAVTACHRAGITVCMITGDHPVTALAIARDLGVASRPDQVVTGRQLEALSPEELRATLQHVRAFARTTPRQKLELVEAARAAGHFVAVTGDGINDAPALRAANIGVAMGKAGTDVARDAADLVITDDNFGTIVSGVEEGRVAYDNVRKVIYLLISTGAAEVLLLTLTMATGWPATEAGTAVLPLLPVQLLWLNLVTNGVQDVALAFEPSEGGALERPPRSPREPIFNRLMVERTLVAASVMATVGFSAFYWMIEVADMSEPSARNALLLLMVLFENVHIGNCRSETKSAFVLSPLRSPILLLGTITAFLVHVGAMHITVTQRLLHLEPVAWTTWVIVPALASTVLVAMEVHKVLWRVRRAEPESSDSLSPGRGEG